MTEFLECRMEVGREHLAVSIYVYACTFGLTEQVLDVVQIVTADEDSRVLAHADIHLRDLRVTISRGVGTVKQFHCLDTHVAGLEYEGNPFVYSLLLGGDGSQRLLDELVDAVIIKAQTHGVFQIGCHTLDTVDGEFLEGTQVFVFLTQYTDDGTYLIEGIFSAAPCHLVYLWNVNITVRQTLYEQIA